MRELALSRPATRDDAESDAVLVQEAQRRPTAFAALYRRYVGSVHRYLYSRLGNTLDAEDITAEVFAEALRALPRYREQGRFAAWLFSIARRKMADHYRHSRILVSLDETADVYPASSNPFTSVMQDEASESLAAVWARLGEEERELLRLRFAANLTYDEIGQLLGRSEGAIKMAIHRLLRRLKNQWEDSDESAS